ncbi:GNAT family N-acetyltransferase [Arenibaculum pallidiluteum]|uniref:GNAT family N-acetyltransferase n=1 Tax=Arenibaculum pallidiluteum TaxID=2812559 RepID=UPI001A96FA2B|nr:GNAT family N-acetyltransferase [Arenibaculum pallidiluteum]
MSTPPEPERFSFVLEAVIRPAAADDLPALEWMGLHSPQRSVIRDAFAAQLRGDGLMLLAVSAGFPVAQVWLDLVRRRSEGIAVLWAVRTFPPLQGAGIGRRLMEAAESELRRRGIMRAELVVERANGGARRFYERLGWRAVRPIEERYWIPDEAGLAVEHQLEGWLMAKDLPP